MPLKLYTMIALSVLFTGCSYHAKPVVSPYFPSDNALIPFPAEVSITGRTDLLDREVVNNSTLSGKACTYTVTIKDEFIKAVNRLVDSKFARNPDSTPTAPYQITVNVDNFIAQFEDLNEGMRIAFGLLAGVPKIESHAEISLHISVSRNDYLVFEEQITAQGADTRGFWDGNDMAASIQKSSEQMAQNALQEMDKRVFVRLAMNSNRNTYNAGGQTGPSISQKLKELDELQRQGLISRQEYEQKKKQLLDRF